MIGVQSKYRIVEQTLNSGKKKYLVQKRFELSLWYIIVFLFIPVIGWFGLYELLSYGKAEIVRDVIFDDLKSANDYIETKIEEYTKAKRKEFMNSVATSKIIK